MNTVVYCRDKRHKINSLHPRRLKHGTDLLDRRRWREAIRVMAQLESLVRDVEGLEVTHARALFDRGLALKEGAYASRSSSLMMQAVDVYSELERRFGRVQEAPFEELLGQGMYNKAGALVALRRIDEGATGFAELARRYSESPNWVLQEAGKLAAVRKRMTFTVPDPPPYVDARVGLCRPARWAGADRGGGPQEGRQKRLRGVSALA